MARMLQLPWTKCVTSVHVLGKFEPLNDGIVTERTTQVQAQACLRGRKKSSAAGRTAAWSESRVTIVKITCMKVSCLFTDHSLFKPKA